MRVRIIRTVRVDGVWLKPGTEIDLSKEVAIALIRLGKAIAIKKVEKHASRKRV